MSRLDRKKLYLSLGLESAETIADGQLADVPETDEVANTELEALDETQDLTADVEQLDDVSDVVESSEELNVAVEAALASGRGLNRIEAAALTMTLKQTMGRYIEVERNVVPAVESYDLAVHDGSAAAENNKEQTKEAKKGIKESIKAFVKAILEKLKMVFKKIANAFKSITDRRIRSYAALKELAKKLNTLPDFANLEIPFNTHNTYIGGKFDLKSLLEGVKNFNHITETYRQNSTSDEEKKFLEAGFSALEKSDEDNWSKMRIGLNGALATFYNRMVPETTKGEDGTLSSKELPGGRVIKFTPGEEKGNKQLSTITLTRGIKNENNDLKEKAVLSDRRTLEDLVDETLIGMTKVLTTLRESSNEIDEIRRTVESRLKLDPKKEANYSNNREQLMSLSNFAKESGFFRFLMFDYNVVLTTNVYEIVKGAFEVTAKQSKAESEGNKEEAA